MFIPDVSTLKLWAYWDLRKTPYYSLYDYKYYIPEPQGLYVFQERKTKKFYSVKIDQLAQLYQAGQFKPFVLVMEKPKPTHFRPFGAGA